MLTLLQQDTGPATGLAVHARNVWSQCGEDGILEAVLGLIGERDHWCVEFGAWDGALCSNTRKLIDEGDSAVLIEADPRRFERLLATFEANPRVTPLEAMVGWEGHQTLDRLLAGTAVPRDFDVLSIDIDGNDYHVWNAVAQYRPKVVVIEYNPSIPDEVDFVQEPDPAGRKGASARALVRLAHAKGYRLAATTVINLVLVREDLFDRLGVADDSLAALRTDHSWEVQAFIGYDGRLHLVSERGMPWHGAPLPDQLRVVPRVFDGFPGDFGLLRRGLLKGWKSWRSRRP